MKIIAALSLVVLCCPVWASDGFVLDLGVLQSPIDNQLALIDTAVHLGARHFTVPIRLCQASAEAVKVRWCDGQTGHEYNPPSDLKSRLKELTDELHKRAAGISYLPFLLADDGSWRGFFEPTDFKAWGASYRARVQQIARMAIENQADEFIVGTELVSIYTGKTEAQKKERREYWRSMLNDMRNTLNPKHDGKVPVFAVANWDQVNGIGFWDASDFVGMSAYFPLTDSDEAPTDIDSLVHGWQPWVDALTALAQKTGKQLYFTEIGYSSMQSAAHTPWSFSPPATLDLELQARLFEAFGKIWRESPSAKLLKRFQVWELNQVDHPLSDTGFTVIGKPAEKILSRIFGDNAP